MPAITTQNQSIFYYDYFYSSVGNWTEWVSEAGFVWYQPCYDGMLWNVPTSGLGFRHLVTSWGRCFGWLWNLQEVFLNRGSEFLRFTATSCSALLPVLLESEVGFLNCLPPPSWSRPTPWCSCHVSLGSLGREKSFSGAACVRHYVTVRVKMTSALVESPSKGTNQRETVTGGFWRQSPRVSLPPEYGEVILPLETPPPSPSIEAGFPTR